MKQYARLSLTVFMLATLSMRAMEPDVLLVTKKLAELTTQYQPERLLTLCINHFGRTRQLCDADGNTFGDLLSPVGTIPENLAIDIINRFPTNVIKQFTEDDECAQNIGNALLTQLPEKKKIAFIQKLAECHAIIQYRNILKQLMNDPKISDDIKKCINQCDPLFQSMKAFLTQHIYAQEWPGYQNIIGHQSRISSVSWSPDGKYIVTGSWDGTAKIWTFDHDTWQCTATLTGHTRAINSVSWLQGKYIATGSDDKTAKIWAFDHDTWQCIATLTGHANGIELIAWSPDGKYLATGSDDKTVKIWTIQDNQWQCIATLTDPNDWINSVSWSPDSKYLATSFSDKTARIWNLNDQCIATLTGHAGTIRSLSWSPDGKYIATGSHDDTAKIWTTDGKCIATLIGHTDWVMSVSWSRDGKYLATDSHDDTAKIWTIGGQCIATLTGHGLNYTARSVWLLDDKYLATNSYGNVIKIWDMRLLNTITQHPFSYDGIELIQEIAQKSSSEYQLNRQEQRIFNQLGGTDQELRDALHDVLYLFVKKHDITPQNTLIKN